MTFRTLYADEIEVRVSRVTEKGVALLLYKNARVDMDVLDEAVGELNWKREHSRDNANCTVSIWDESKEQWISKEDTGVESNTEAEKGKASDSFKRACVNWGIGRELYSAPDIMIWSPDAEIKKGRNGNPACYDKFSVTRIDYNENRKISGLEITNETKKRVVFKWGNADKTEYYCDICGEILGDTVYNGKTYSPEQWAKASKRKYAGCICATCISAMKGDE